MIDRTQRSQVATAQDYKNRVMRRITPTIILAFIVVGVLAATNSLNAANTRLQDEQRQAANVTASLIDSTVVQNAQQNLLAIAGRRPVREFAELLLSRDDVSDPFAANIQRTLLADFAFLMGRDANYLSVRFITSGTTLGSERGTSRVWTERRLDNGVAQLRSEPYPNPWLNDPAFLSVTTQVDGVVIFSDVTRLTVLETGVSRVRPIVHLYTPVTLTANPNTVIGVLQLEVDLQFAVDIVKEQITANPTLNFDTGRRVVLLGTGGQIIADSADTQQSYVLDLAMDERQANSPVFTVVDPNLPSRLPTDITTVLAENAAGFDAQQMGSYVLSARNIAVNSPTGSEWRLLIIDQTSAFFGPTITTALLTFGIIVGVGLLVVVLLEVLLRPMLRPVAEAAALVERLTAAQTGGAVSVGAATPSALIDGNSELDRQPEIARLLGSFQRMTSHVETLRQDYEAQYERRTRNLELAAQISRETVALTDIENLLNRAIELICRQLGFYHAQVFLVDDAREFARLVFSRGEAGKQLLARGHKLPVGSKTVVGKVTAQGSSVVVNDTLNNTSGEPHRPNPLLPDTRAELGLPLKVGQEVIGVLDIQSLTPNVFAEHELPTYQLLADQLAISIQNARLISASEERINQINKLNRQLTRTGWESVEQEQIIGHSYSYNLMDVQPINDEESALASGAANTLSAPINIRGEVIGTLTASIGDFGYTDGDQMILRAVAERVALALENARLFQQTQANLAETSRLYEIGQALGEANTLEEITAAVVRTAFVGASGGQLWFFGEYDPQPEEMLVVVDVPVKPRSVGTIEGLRLNFAEHPLIAKSRPDQVTLVYDTQHDARIDSRLGNLLRQLDAAAAVIIPITVRDEWYGFLMIAGEQPRQFTEREGRIFTTLIAQASTSIENRLLMEQTEDALARNENLYSASRIINQAQNEQDLVYAAVATTEDPTLNFSLSLLGGELDETGWPTQGRVVAQSDGTQINELNVVHQVFIPPSSPMRRRDPEVLVDRSPEDPNPSQPIQWLRRQGYRSAAVFPLFSANRPIAVFYVYSKELREFSLRDNEIYKALTGQMSTVLQNRRLLEQTSEALDETRRLYAATSAITSAQDLEDVYRTAVQHIAVFRSSSDARSGALGGLSRVGILFAYPTPHPDAPELECVYAWSDGSAAGFGVGQRLSASVVPFGRMTAEANGAVSLSRGREGTASPPWTVMPHTMQALIVPIQSREKWFGVFACESMRADLFDEQYQRFLQAIADQVAIAVENRQLFEEAQNEAQRALALAEAGQFAAQIGQDFEMGVSELFRRTAGPAGYDRWLLMLLPESGANHLVNVVYHTPGLQGEDIKPNLHLEVRENEHSVADAVLLQRALIVNDPARYPAFRDRGETYIEQFVGKHIAMPIRSGRRILGSLLVGRSLSASDLDERDVQFISTLAAQVAVALENRRLFQAAEEERGTLNNILESMPVGVLVIDPYTYRPVRFNTQAQLLLGKPIDDSKAFDPFDYDIYRTGMNVSYPLDELPLFTVLEGGQAFADDLVVKRSGDQTDLQMSATLIANDVGEPVAIIAGLADISNLRSLENTLQSSLRETVALYEAQSAFAQAGDLEEVFDVLIAELGHLQPVNAALLLTQEDGSVYPVRTMTSAPTQPAHLSPLLDFQDMVMITDVTRDKTLASDLKAVLQADGVGALLTIPLRSPGRTQPRGWLMITDEKPRRYTLDDERFISNLRDIASTVIDNRYLILATEGALQQTNALYSATTAISRTGGDLTQLGIVLQNALESYRGDFYAAYLYADVDRLINLEELFNINVDGDPLALHPIIERHEFPREARYIEDLYAVQEPDALERDLLALGHIRSAAIITLRAKGIPAGCLVVAQREVKPFTLEDRRYFGAVADSASVVVDNVMLFEEIQSTLEETSTLYQASRALTQVASPEDLLSVIVDFLRGDHVSQVFIALLNTRTWDALNPSVLIQTAWTEASDGVDLTGVTLSPERFPAWEVLKGDLVRTINDIYDENSELTELERAGIASLDARSLAVLPLRVPKRDIGAIWLGSSEPHIFTESEQRIFQSFSEQASLSLEALYLLQQTERRATQLETSAEVSRSAGTILDLNVLLPRVVNLIRESFGYDHAQVFLMDEQDDWAMLRASTGEAGRQLLAIGHKLQKGSQSVIGQVTLRAEPVLAMDTAEQGGVHRPNTYLPLTRSELALPLVVKGRVVGALDVQSNQPNFFTEDDIKVLTTLAAQIGVAIDNAQLYEQSQTRANEMAFMFDVTTAAAAAESLEEALDGVAKRLRDMFNAQGVVIYLPRTYIDKFGDKVMVLQPFAMTGGDNTSKDFPDIPMHDPAVIIAQIAQQRQPMLIDLQRDTRYRPIASNARSALAVPLLSGAELVGVVVVESARINAFSFDAVNLLIVLGGSLSAIIQNAQLLSTLKERNEQLTELDRVKSDFLANMSHELRTPLNSIIGFSRVMLKGIDGPLTEMQEQDLTTIYSSGQLLLNLINDILDQAKIQSGKMDLKMDYFEIKPVIESVRSIGIGFIKQKEKQLNIQIEVAPNIPPAYGDEFRTRQVLNNLVSNAVKFTQDGSIMLSAYLVEIAGKAMIRIDVIDTGIGIAEKDMPLLFEAFRQVDSSLTRTQGGTGLGLPISKSLVEMQGGEMLVQSKVNSGSTFSITIPVGPSEEAQALLPSEGELSDDDTSEFDALTTVETSAPLIEETGKFQLQEVRAVIPPTKRTTGSVPTIKRHVLLVEDNPARVDQFRRSLQREGFEVTTGDEPMIAMALATGLRPTLIVIDVNFHKGQGWEMLRQLKDRDDTFDIPVVVATLNGESERAYRMGAHTFLQHPFPPEELLEAVLKAEQESNTERILIIDDQPEAVRLIEDLLHEHGNYRVFSANSGQDGIALVARRRPDLVILDLRMPGMDGFAVLNELRSNPETANIPVLVVTGDTLNAAEQDMLMNVRVMPKADLSPQSYEQFIKGVHTHLNGE